MFVNGYSLALLICSFASLFLACMASRTGLKVLLHWDGDSDTAAQIALESETWLAALLVEFGLLLQIVSLLLLVIAADSFSHVLVGAMCAAGAFLANDYGISALILKIIGVFLYGYWIVVHRLDISSEYLPLIRIKFGYLLLLIPLLGADLLMVVQYLRLLEPDIITSCCGVLFGNSSEGGYNLVGPVPAPVLLLIFYALALFLFISSWRAKKSSTTTLSGVLNGCCWLIFFYLSLLLITSVFSSYIYAMPSHRCPFDILKSEYNYIGFPLYLLLFTLCFAGSSSGFILIFSSLPGLHRAVAGFRAGARKISLILLPLFLLLCSWYPVVYLLVGGEF